MRYAERKAFQVPILQLNEHNEQGKEGYQANGSQKNTTLQRLQTQIHAQESEAGTVEVCDTMDMIRLAFDMTAADQEFVEKIRRFYYWVILMGYRCPKCNGPLTMVAEGRCKCQRCRNELDPTVTFQRCSVCGGAPVLRVRRYICEGCGGDLVSDQQTAQEMEMDPFQMQYDPYAIAQHIFDDQMQYMSNPLLMPMPPGPPPDPMPGF